MQYIAIITTGLVFSYVLYYIDSNNNEQNKNEINYTKYITTFIVVCLVSTAGIYMYNNPNTVDSESIGTEIKRNSNPINDPSVIASLPDF